MKSKLLIALIALLSCHFIARAQDVAVKTNLLYDALLTVDAGVEVGVAPQWTVELTGNLNAWTISDRRWKQWNFQPEARYWFCRAFAGHFVGAHLIGGQYNFGNLNMDFKFLGTDFAKLKEHRYQGWMAGAGIAYGYTWLFDKHWSMEAEIGIGWIYTRYDEFECRDCGQRIRKNHPHNYVGPTKAALNLIYNF
ncbi:MAG: DUF3575 domain-containing protein [Muribaculaceae bacterium]|nr:DUF3575 domain-containing protein [Muribaculaceae bacterium]